MDAVSIKTGDTSMTPAATAPAEERPFILLDRQRFCRKSPLPENREALRFFIEDGRASGDFLGYGTEERYLREGLGIADPDAALQAVHGLLHLPHQVIDIAPADDLQVLPDRINAAVAAAETHARSAVECAIRAGSLLTQAKALVQHGEWEQWLQQHVTCAARTAQAYMRLYQKHRMLPAPEAQRVALLPLREASAAKQLRQLIEVQP